MFPVTLTNTLVASAILGLIGLMTLLTHDELTTFATMRLEPIQSTVLLNESFSVDVVVESSQPVNAFQGLIQFDDTLLDVNRIDYNTSIADLWVEEPWYSLGEGTITFAGGTTRPGGFSGTGTLLSVVFTPRAVGDVTVALNEARLLEHNGFGTDATLLPSIDALFSVDTVETNAREVVTVNTSKRVLILNEVVELDLNGDGRVSVADVSIFMVHIFGNNPRYDFNYDGKVNLADLSILMNGFDT
jgi:hypothetical protein